MNRKILITIAGIIICGTNFIKLTALADDEVKTDTKKSKKSLERTLEAEPLIIDGDKVEYFREEDKVVAEGNVVATYKDMKLTCNKATALTDEKVVYAEGNVILTYKQGIFKGERVKYDFNTGKAEVIHPSMEKVGPWYGEGKEGRKYAEEKYLVNDGYITTCDLEEPHYKLQAKRIKIYWEDKVIARHIVFKVKDIPLMYFPYYEHPLDDDRPRVTIIPGHSSDWGYYLLTAWRYVLSPIGSGRIHLDYRELKGLAQGFDTNYHLPKNFGKGRFRFYYTHEHDKVPPNNEPPDTWKERYRIQLKHTTNIGQNSFRMEYHKMKDEDFIKDYYYDEEYKKDHQPDSYLSLIHSNPNYNLSFLAKKRMNRFFTVTEKLPEIKFDLRKAKIKNTPFYFDNDITFSNLSNKYANSARDDDVVRLDTYNEFSYPFKVLRFYNMEPWIGMRQTYYTKDSSGEEDKLRGIFYTGMDVSTKLYRIFDVETNFLNLNIHKLRHIISPTIEYKYIHQPTIVSNQLMDFDSIDEISRTNLVTLGLENRLQTKRKAGKVDLGYLRTTIDYNFKPEYGSSWENLKGDLELTPYPWLRLESDCKFNPRTRDFEKVNFDTFLTGSNYEFGLGHRYQQDTSSLVTTQFKYYINKNKKWTKRWILDTYFRFESETKEWEEVQLKLTKDLHCWLADFVYNFKQNQTTEEEKNHTFYVVFRLKAFPDIPFKLFETSYQKPKPGM